MIDESALQSLLGVRALSTAIVILVSLFAGSSGCLAENHSGDPVPSVQGKCRLGGCTYDLFQEKKRRVNKLAWIMCRHGGITHVDGHTLLGKDSEPKKCGRNDAIFLSPGRHELRLGGTDYEIPLQAGVRYVFERVVRIVWEKRTKITRELEWVERELEIGDLLFGEQRGRGGVAREKVLLVCPPSGESCWSPISPAEGQGLTQK